MKNHWLKKNAKKILLDEWAWDGNYWTHIVVQFDGNRSHLFIDGVKQ